MNRTVEKGKTLLVDGPASVKVVTGEVEVFGHRLKNTAKVIIREGKRLPFVSEGGAATVDISLGENAVVENVDGHTVPSSWIQSFEELASLKEKPVTVVVLGAADSGKTSFCTYLINRLLQEKRRVAVLDGDLGQSDIGPPCTVAYAFVVRPITDLFNVKEKNAFFVGVTSPKGAIDKVTEGLVSLKEEILKGEPDVIVVNTDGWIEGEEAVNYKVRLVEKLQPDLVFGIQQKEELTFILNALQSPRKVVVDSPAAIRQRSQEKRKNLRELGYIKYLRNAKIQSLPLSWLRIEGDEFIGLGKSYGNMHKARKICELLGMRPLHLAELDDRISVFIGRRRWIELENIKKVEDYSKKRVVLIRKGEEEGLLTALCSQEGKFLGVGVLQEIDFVRKILKILTPVSEPISTIAIGKVRLDKNLREVPTFAENNLDFADFKKLF